MSKSGVIKHTSDPGFKRYVIKNGASTTIPTSNPCFVLLNETNDCYGIYYISGTVIVPIHSTLSQVSLSRPTINSLTITNNRQWVTAALVLNCPT